MRFALLMVAVSVLVFVLVSLSPIDPVQANVGQAAYAGMSPEKKAALAQVWEAEPRCGLTHPGRPFFRAIGRRVSTSRFST